MWKKRTVLIVLSLLMFKAQANEPESLKSSIDSFMHTVMDDFNITSASSIAVVNGEGVLYQNTFGYADVANKVNATNDTLFYTASMTKPIFALTVLAALERSRYTLDHTLDKMFPTITFSPSLHAQNITIRDLLSHKSGLDDDYLAMAVSTSGLHDIDKKMQMLAAVFANERAPLGKFEYSNLGYNIVSIWYEKTFNKTWQAGIKSSVFEPLEMTRSTAKMSDALTNDWLVAKPYSFFNKQINQSLYLRKQDNTMHAAGGVISTSTDMAKFLAIQLKGQEDQNNSALPLKRIQKSQQKIAEVDSKRGDFNRTGYALGWYTGQYKNKLTYHHFGSFDGFRPHMSFIPSENIGLVILNNEGDLNDKLTDIIADLIYGKLLNDETTNKRVAKRLSELKTTAFSYREKAIKHEDSYKNKSWNLSLPLSSYTGTYSHPLAGNVNVSHNNGNITVVWGNLTSTATAHNKLDAMRVKLRPSKAQLIRFKHNNTHVNQLVYGGTEFKRNN